MQKNKYGNCDLCGYNLSPIWYKQLNEDTNKIDYLVSYLLCDNCGKCYIVDDSFDIKN